MRIKDKLILEEEKLFGYSKPDTQEDIKYQEEQFNDPDFDIKLDAYRNGEIKRY